jgi:deoxyribodipyrimidine photolyase-related protein
MKEVTVIFPHQLFSRHPADIPTRPVALIEDDLFFRQLKFHKKKIILHRASMKAYEHELKTRGIQTSYFNAIDNTSLDDIFRTLQMQGFEIIHYVMTEDYLLERRVKRYAKSHAMELCEYDSPSFICSMDYLNDFFARKKRYFLNDFYIEQRRRLDILIDGDVPVGGKWTYDIENRKKMPSSVTVPVLPKFHSQFLKEAIDYTNTHFGENYGTSDGFLYPVSRRDALNGLQIFLDQRFTNYGVYQDAIIENDSYLFHSVLTPALNIGLLTPAEILDRAVDHATERNIPINSLEGFVRQILGWREFIRALYHREGTRQRKENYWGHKNPVPDSFWSGTTGVTQVDNVIQKVLQTSYSNHIERLMIMGNFMLLCEFDPDEVYRWFMELYIDAYDWVMVPNVYGMSQYADGGLMSTKPYISGSNYLLKMSDFKKGTWCAVWDSLYWSFIQKHRQTFSRNPRMSMMVRQLDNMDSERRRLLQTQKENFLEKLLR